MEQARPSLAALSDALPPFRALAIELTPSVQELPSTIRAANPWLDQAEPLLSRGRARRARPRAAGLDPAAGRDDGRLQGAVHPSESFSHCVPHNLVPTGDLVIDDNDGTYPFGQGAPGFPSGITNFQEFLSCSSTRRAPAQGFDGNGIYLRANTGGGNVLGSTPYPPGGFRNTTVFGNNQGDYLGTRPTFTAATPPYRPDVACASNPLPDVNGTGGTGLPGDVGAPQPATVAP